MTAVLDYVKGTFTADGTLTIPAGNQVLSIVEHETNGVAMGAKLKLGTTTGAQDIRDFNVAANSCLSLPPAASAASPNAWINAQTVYVTSTNWNGASVDLAILIAQFTP